MITIISILLLVGFGLAWSSIAASETDADSPLSQTLFDKIRGNLDYLYARRWVMLDPPVSLTTTEQTAWTDLTITTTGSTGTIKYALLELRIEYDDGFGSGDYAILVVRPNGSSWANDVCPSVKAVNDVGASQQASDRNMAMVPVDASNKIEYKHITNTTGISIEILQLGFWEEE